MGITRGETAETRRPEKKIFRVDKGLHLRRTAGSDAHFDILVQGKFAGSASIWNDECQFWNLAVDPEYRGRGIGRKVYEFIEGKFYAERCERITLYAVTEAVPFWESLGFERTENRILNEMEKPVGGGGAP
jgi:ribosomal protein S18 acetylase RimI-like enzyme